MRPDKDIYYMRIACDVAQRSTCLRRHYGAVIVKNDEIIATGYNGAPRGQENCCDKGFCIREAEGHAHNDGNYQSCPAVHAEANAIISAARKDMIGATLYLYGEEDGCVIKAEPCPNCRGLITNAGIETVIGSAPLGPWIDNQGYEHEDETSNGLTCINLNEKKTIIPDGVTLMEDLI